jgi:hypothetical protein
MRAEVASLVHQRPFEKMTIPSLVSSISTTQKSVQHFNGIRMPLSSPTAGSGECYDREYEHLVELCKFYLINPPPHGATFFSHALGGGAVNVRWERHSEFATYTFHRPASTEDLARPFAEDVVAIASLPSSWVERIPGSVISAVHFAVHEHAPKPSSSEPGAEQARVGPAKGPGPTDLDEEQFREVKRTLNHYGHITGAVLHNKAFRMYSDFRLKSDSFGNILMYATEHANRMALGKVIQRLIDMEKVTTLCTVPRLPASCRGEHLRRAHRRSPAPQPRPPSLASRPPPRPFATCSTG